MMKQSYVFPACGSDDRHDNADIHPPVAYIRAGPSGDIDGATFPIINDESKPVVIQNPGLFKGEMRIDIKDFHGSPLNYPEGGMSPATTSYFNNKRRTFSLQV